MNESRCGRWESDRLSGRLSNAPCLQSFDRTVWPIVFCGAQSADPVLGGATGGTKMHLIATKTKVGS